MSHLRSVRPFVLCPLTEQVEVRKAVIKRMQAISAEMASLIVAFEELDDPESACEASFHAQDFARFTRKADGR